MLVHDIAHASLWSPVERYDLIEDETLDREVQRIRRECAAGDGLTAHAAGSEGADVVENTKHWQQAIEEPLTEMQSRLTPLVQRNRSTFESIAAAVSSAAPPQSVLVPAPDDRHGATTAPIATPQPPAAHTVVICSLLLLLIGYIVGSQPWATFHDRTAEYVEAT